MSIHKLIQRLRKMGPFSALVTTAAIILGGLMLLPLILLFAFVAFIGMTLLSRQYMNYHRVSPHSPPKPNHDGYRAHPNLERETSIKAYQTGRTLNH
ncbi:hypothetical protein ACWXWU_16060 [Shewanella sp. A14]